MKRNNATKNVFTIIGSTGSNNNNKYKVFKDTSGTILMDNLTQHSTAHYTTTQNNTVTRLAVHTMEPHPNICNKHQGYSTYIIVFLLCVKN